MRDKDQVWASVLAILKDLNTNVSYNTWFVPLKIHSIDDTLHIVYIESNNEFTTNILKSRYLPMLQDSFKNVLEEEYKVVIKLKEEYEQEKPSSQAVKTKVKKVNHDLNSQKIFNPKYNFDNFVVGSSNKYAHAAALAVAEFPSEAYNPLFIYGGSGLGKTHLMHAIGIYLLENNDNINVLYVSSEMFTNEFIKAIREKKSGEFKNKYRHVDVLLIDDIQFLEGKEETQIEFFNTFNTLYDSNKQIVISSDRPPNKLSMLSDRLRSRFAWNMIADLAPADYETRVAILVKKAENFNMPMDDDLYAVICLIAEKITNNIRELEGALNRIISYSNLMNEKIDQNFARRILKDILANNGDSPTPEKIKTVVSRYFNVSVSDLESKKRTKNIAFARQMAMYLCRNMTDYSLPKIGNLFGDKHYTTVMHACDKIQSEASSDSTVMSIIEKLQNDIKGVNK